MKLSLLIFWLLLFSCRNIHKNESPVKTKIEKPGKDQQVMIDTLYRTKSDTVKIEYEFDTLIYVKETFNEIADHFPELHKAIPLHPDIEYFRSGTYKDIIDHAGNPKHISFGSEDGRDAFCLLYAYFLKKRNTSPSAEKVRINLIEIFNRLNDIFGLLYNGGTFYGHQFPRIKGYAEYWTYWYGREYPENKTRVMAGQKELFVTTLKQEISDVMENEHDFPDEKEKGKKRRKLFMEIKKLEGLLSNNFLVRRAQEFRYSYYQ